MSPPFLSPEREHVIVEVLRFLDDIVSYARVCVCVISLFLARAHVIISLVDEYGVRLRLADDAGEICRSHVTMSSRSRARFLDDDDIVSCACVSSRFLST